MSEIFISYASQTAAQANQIAQTLRGQGYAVWRDDELPAHRSYADVIEERLRGAKAVVVVWSEPALHSQWVRAEADFARNAGTLVQLSIDGILPPMPFNQIQCADMKDWLGDAEASGWRKVIDSIDQLTGRRRTRVKTAPATAPAPSVGKPSIAVLPFANLTGDAGEDYFADGMVEEISTALSRIRSIFVIASGSTLSLKATGISPEDAARKLNVRYVLEGSVRKSGGVVRIAVKLIDASDGVQVWAERYDGALEDVFALQDRVAVGVAGVIEPTMLAAEVRRAASSSTDSVSAYDLYLRALPFQRSNSSAETFAAIELLQRAIALDPDYGAALALAALCHNQVFIYDWSKDAADHHRQAVELAYRAIKDAGDDAEVLARAAPVLLHESEADAVGLVDRAMALNPGCSFAWYVSGLIRTVEGHSDLAVEHLTKSMQLDPLSPYRPAQLSWLGAARFEQERFSDAAPLLREAAQLMPAVSSSHALLAACYGHLGNRAAAGDALARFRSLTDTPIEVFGERTFRNPAHRRLLLDGLANAEAGTAADA
jgi:adenylate cyclase